jgi:hypothetical protein
MSVMGVPVTFGKHVAPPPRKQPWVQDDVEKSCCLVTLAARDEASATGVICKVGPELCVLTNQLLVQSEPTACFASAEFFFGPSSKPQHTSKLNPHILWDVFGVENPDKHWRGQQGKKDIMDYNMVVIGLEKANRPVYEDRVKKGVMHELKPLELTTDLDDYPEQGDEVMLLVRGESASGASYGILP